MTPSPTLVFMNGVRAASSRDIQQTQPLSQPHFSPHVIEPTIKRREVSETESESLPSPVIGFVLGWLPHDAGSPEYSQLEQRSG